jgi:hypothetical protein
MKSFPRILIAFAFQIESAPVSNHVYTATEHARLGARVVPVAIVLACTTSTIAEAKQLLLQYPIVAHAIQHLRKS